MARTKKTTPVKSCTKCGTELEVTAENFYRDKSQKDGFAPWCKACERSYNKAYNAALKATAVARKGDIEDADAVGEFDTLMSDERVTRGQFKARGKADAKRTPAAKAKTKTRKATRAAKAKVTPKKRTGRKVTA